MYNLKHLKTYARSLDKTDAHINVWTGKGLALNVFG